MVVISRRPTRDRRFARRMTGCCFPIKSRSSNLPSPCRVKFRQAGYPANRVGDDWCAAPLNLISVGQNNLSALQQQAYMKFVDTLKRLVRNSFRSTDLIAKLVETLSNELAAVKAKLDKLIEAHDNQSTAVNERLDKLIEARDNQSTAVNERLDKLIEA